MSKVIIGIDPGNKETATVVLCDGKISEHHYDDNDRALLYIEALATIEGAEIYCEMIASYGMAVGKSVFETCLFIGKILQVAPQTKLITRNVVKNAICHSSKAKDANIRQALIDRFGPQGTKKAPGPLFGVTSHYLAALAVAVYAAETKAVEGEYWIEDLRKRPIV